MDLQMKEITVSNNGDGTVNVEGETTLIDENGNAAIAKVIIPRATFDEHGPVIHQNREQRRKQKRRR